MGGEAAPAPDSNSDIGGETTSVTGSCPDTEASSGLCRSQPRKSKVISKYAVFIIASSGLGAETGLTLRMLAGFSGREMRSRKKWLLIEENGGVDPTYFYELRSENAVVHPINFKNHVFALASVAIEIFGFNANWFPSSLFSFANRQHLASPISVNDMIEHNDS